MKKTFISPVAEIVATETVELIAQSTLGVSNEQKGGSETNPLEAGARSNGTGVGPSTGLDLETLDF